MLKQIILAKVFVKCELVCTFLSFHEVGAKLSLLEPAPMAARSKANLRQNMKMLSHHVLPVQALVQPKIFCVR